MAAHVGSASCLQAVGVECGLIGGEYGLTGSSIGPECEPETTPVCKPECYCLQAATATTSLASVGSDAGSPALIRRPLRARGHEAEILDV